MRHVARLASQTNELKKIHGSVAKAGDFAGSMPERLDSLGRDAEARQTAFRARVERLRTSTQ
jgi:hypothetical protein